MLFVFINEDRFVLRLREFNFASDGWLLAINEQIKTAVLNGNRPPLDAITEPVGWLSTLRRLVHRDRPTPETSSLLSSLTGWIAECWHQLPEKRPPFDGN